VPYVLASHFSPLLQPFSPHSLPPFPSLSDSNSFSPSLPPTPFLPPPPPPPPFQQTNIWFADVRRSGCVHFKCSEWGIRLREVRTMLSYVTDVLLILYFSTRLSSPLPTVIHIYSSLYSSYSSTHHISLALSLLSFYSSFLPPTVLHTHSLPPHSPSLFLLSLYLPPFTSLPPSISLSVVSKQSF
jgi:hypothetical protein